jgi:uncharacterized protein
MSGHLYFEIQADDMDRAADFYSAIFDWKFQRHESQESLPVQYYRIETGGTAGGLMKRPSDTPPPECGTNAFTCSFEVEDFDATAGKILESVGETALEKFAIPGVCWQGYYSDTEGNTFGIFQVDENAN